jgi:hypothetical protein
MKSPSLLFTALGILAAAALHVSCQKTDASSAKTEERVPENGAQFKEGRGLDITDEMKRAIGLQTSEVAEEKLTPTVSVSLDTVQPHSACGWITPEQASLIQPGMEAVLTNPSMATTYKGVVERVERMPLGKLGDHEVTITSKETLPAGSPLTATFQGAETGVVPVVPTSALFKTAEGSFVYAVNDGFYVRTRVMTGPSDGKLVEITDGLYSGDEIVTTPVMSLWMAELQVLRGGKACTCGH